MTIFRSAAWLRLRAAASLRTASLRTASLRAASLRAASLPLFLLVLALYSAAYLRGVAAVPFHPDESSYLFMSNELKAMITNPASLSYSPTASDWKRQTMRLLNPPLVQIVVELGRRTSGLPPLPHDWNWEQSWQQNEAAEVVPAPRLLQAARMAVAGLFPFSLLLLFLAVRRLSGDFTAWGTVFLMATNALLLLHTRRAMAEGVLIFTLALFLWTLFTAERRPWLITIAAALAFCAKTSLAPLLLVGLAAVLWPAEGSRRWLPRLRQAAIYLGITALIVISLYPVMWGQPVQAFQAAAHQREALMQAQAKDYAWSALPSLPDRLGGLLRQVFFAAPSFFETPKYQPITQASEAAYLASPLHGLFRSPLGGGVLLGLAILGLGAAVWQLRRTVWLAPCASQRWLALMVLATALQAGALVVVIPLEWQRYYIPLVPFACFWAAYGLNVIRGWVKMGFRKLGQV